MHQDNYKLESGQVIWDKFGNPQRIISVATEFSNPSKPSYGTVLRCENLTKVTGSPIGFVRNRLVGQCNLFEEDFEKI